MSLERARLLLADARLDEAEVELRALTAAHPDDPEIALEYAFSASAQGRFDVAVARFSKARQRFRGTIAADVGLAEALVRAGRIADARAIIAQHAGDEDCNPWLLLTAARAEYASGCKPVGRTYAERAISSAPGGPDIFAAAATLFETHDEAQLARDVIDRAHAHFPEHPGVLQARATHFTKRQQWSAALDAWCELDRCTVASTLAARGIAEALANGAGHTRSVIAVYGNCQAEFVCTFLDHVPHLALRYQFVPVPNFSLPGTPIAEIGERAGAAVLLWEQFDRQPEGTVRDRLRTLLDGKAARLTFPALFMSALWPFLWPDERIVLSAEFPWGRYPYGDRIGLEVAAEGLSGQSAVREYHRRVRSQMPNVERLRDREFAYAQQADDACDVHMHDFVRARFCESHLFRAWGHVSGVAIGELVRRLCLASSRYVEFDAAIVETQIERAQSIFPRQGTEDLPIHPEVIRHLGLRFADEATRYNWFGNQWTFDEYIERYITLDESWNAFPAQGRAQGRQTAAAS